MIKYVSGDLLESNLSSYAHGCNCAGIMGGGIAVEFRRRWPDMYSEYRARCLNTVSPLKPGDMFFWTDISGKHIYNLMTQKSTFGATLYAVQESITKMINHMSSNGIKDVGIPRIGAGLGGLEWCDVKDILESLANASLPTIFVFETYIPGKALDLRLR